jgi:type I restriction enzyme M protein
MSVATEPILLVPAGKLRCYIHPDIFRLDTPEEHVRQRVARSLVEEYGYDRSDIVLEFPIKIGSGTKKRVDIAIFPPGQPHKQEHICIIVEAKREELRPTDRKEGVEQLQSYLAACMNARWGLWVGSELRALEKEIDPSRAKKNPFLDATDIPLNGADEPKPLQFTELVPATDGLRAVFKRCHNYLHVNGNLGKEKAFFELLKLIFCKSTTSGNRRGRLNSASLRTNGAASWVSGS